MNYGLIAPKLFSLSTKEDRICSHGHLSLYIHGIRLPPPKEFRFIRALSQNNRPEPEDGTPFPESLRGSHKRSGSYDIRPKGIVEGAIGILLVAGAFMVGGKVIWQKASQLASLPQRYEIIADFPFASGITVGTPVRMRGVDVGSVIHVRPCLEGIDTHIQVIDSKIIIPRNSQIEVNQSGLAGETMIDIMPLNPVPRPSVSPLDDDCSSEGLIVCDKERIHGQQGVSMDDLIRICGKMSRGSEVSDLVEVFKVGQQLGSTLEDGKPLLKKFATLVEDVKPMVETLRDVRVLEDVLERLKEATNQLENLRKNDLTEEKSRSLAKEVSDLALTMKNIEDMSSEMSKVFGNEKNQRDVKRLIQLLVRLIDT